MPILFLPPTEFVTDNPETATVLRAEGEAYGAKLLAELGVSGVPTRIETHGALRGLKRYAWDGPRDAILAPVFLLPSGQSQSAEFARLGTLVWKSDCILAGAVWEAGNAPLRGFPPELVKSAVPLARIRTRPPDTRSSFRWESQIDGALSKRLALLLEAVGGERFAAAGHNVNSTLSRLACKWAPPPDEPSPTPAAPVEAPVSPTPVVLWPSVVPTAMPRPADFPRRPHRVVRAVVRAARATRSDAWPSVTASASMTGGVFGDRKETVVAPGAAPSLFLPVTFADAALRAAGPLAHDVRQGTFSVTKRKGRWIFLDRGRAYGLEIGTHLTGPGRSRLHVIHFAPDEAGVDVGVAFIRVESEGKPVAPGDAIVFDATEFPTRARPALETNPL